MLENDFIVLLLDATCILLDVPLSEPLLLPDMLKTSLATQAAEPATATARTILINVRRFLFCFIKLTLHFCHRNNRYIHRSGPCFVITVSRFQSYGVRAYRQIIVRN